MIRILVTGGCGFVGAAICLALVDHLASARVTVLDSLRRRGSELNRDRLLARGVRVEHGDVRVASDVEGLGPFDWVIDAAAEPSVLAGTSGTGVGSRQLVEHNLIGTLNLLEAAVRWQAGLVLLSTSRVYSIPEVARVPLVVRESARGEAFAIDPVAELPPGIGVAGIREDCSTMAPVSLYGATKVASESLALEYAHRFGLPLCIDRCGVLAGAGQFGKADQGIFSWWIHSWAAGRPLAYIGFGGLGRQVRDCLHPADLASLILKQIGERNPEPVLCNVAGGGAAAVSLAELSRWCSERFGPREVKTAPETRPYDLPWIVLDSGRAENRYDWRPTRDAWAICEEIASHAATHPDWLDRCGG